jgi:hypothetical protein
MARYGAPGRLYLPRSDPAAGRRTQPILAEADPVATASQSAVAALLLFPEFRGLGL